MADLTPDDWHHRFRQQARWTQDLRRHLLGESALDQARRILEVGCGTGAILTDFASQPALQVHGLDLNPEHLQLARREASFASLTLGDGHLLPYPARCFDLTLCHFLLLWVDDPLRVIAEMRRVTRSGGVVMALAEPDYGGRIDFPLALAELGSHQELALQGQGADPRMGRRLRALMTQSGLRTVEVGVLGGRWLGSPAADELETEWAVLEADIGQDLPAEKLEALRKKDQAAWEQGERILFIPTFYARGLR